MPKVTGNSVELLLLLPELFVEFLRIVRLRLESLLSSCLVVETSSVQVAFFDHVTVGAELVVNVATNEMHCWQLKLLAARITVFLVEVFARSLHALNVLSHCFNALRHLLHT